MDLVPLFSRLASYVALAAALYAAYELVMPAPAGQRWAGVVARIWICLLLGSVGIDEIIFGQNALLVAGYLLGVPLFPLQIGVAISIVAATWAWIES